MSIDLDSGNALRGLLALARLVREQPSAPALFEAAAGTIAETLGFRTVAVSVYRPAWDDFEVAAVHGNPDAEAALAGRTVGAAVVASLLGDLSDAGVVFLPAAEPVDDDPRAWHPADALLVPLRHSQGRLLGVVSLDEPLSGLRPDAEALELLDALAVHVAHALESALAADAAERHRRALEELMRVSATLAESGSAEAVLQAVCDGIVSALGFELAVVELADREADRYRPVARAGAYALEDLELHCSIADFDRVFDPAFEVEGCFLLSNPEAHARVGAGPSSFESSLNGRGARAWNRHWLIVPLQDAEGRRHGFIWADDPSDRLLPGPEKLQALRLFANEAAAALQAATRVEQLHRVGEERRALIEASPLGILFVGRDRRIQSWNTAARDLFGYPDEEVIGHEPPWVAAEEREAFRRRFDAELEGGVRNRVYSDLRADGSRIEVATNSAPVRDAAGEVVGVMATIEDITDKVRSERDLARRNAELEALHETTLHLVDRLDPASVLETVVARACTLLGTEHAYLDLLEPGGERMRLTVGLGVFADSVGVLIERHEDFGGSVWASGRPVTIADYRSWEGRVAAHEDSGVRAMAGVPLRTGDVVTGVLAVASTEPERRFDASELALLSRFGQLVSLVLENARLYEAAHTELAERRAAEAELGALHETTLDLLDRLALDDVLETITRRATALLGAEDGFVYLVDEDAGRLSLTVGIGAFAANVGATLERGEGLCGLVWERRGVLAVESYGAWAGAAEQYRGIGFRPVVGVPLLSGTEVIGVLGIARAEGDAAFAEHEVALLERFAHLASLALENARLFEAAQRELTDRRQAEEALRHSQELYRAIVDNSTDLIALLAPDGEVLYRSPSHADVLGYAAGEARGSALSVVHPDDTETVREAVAAAFRGERAGTYEARVRHRDGRWLVLEGAVAPVFDERGRAHMALAIARDVTVQRDEASERRKLEEQLRQAQKLEAVGRLAGGIAHDFNNLVTAITGYGELALGQLDEGSPVRRKVEEMKRAGERAADLTRQLLAFSRRQVLQPRVIDLNEVVGGVEHMLGRLLGEDVDLVTELARDLGRTRADPGQIEQVVVNLAINARDAMPRGGRLTIRTENATLDERFATAHGSLRGGEHVLLSVADTGEGMDAETLERVFEPFFTTKPAGRGTGLGLSTVYGIVKQTGGQIWAYSEPGRGTTFKVYLPRVFEAAEAPAPAAPAPRVAGTETVLLVEDEPVVRALVAEMLASAGYAVLEAADAEEALAAAAAAEGRIDLLMTDVVMPGRSGPELAERLRADRPGLGVLFTSGYTEDAIAGQGVLRPGTAFLEKPFTAADLGRALRDVLDGERGV